MIAVPRTTPKVERQPNGEVWVDVPLQGCPGSFAEFVVEPYGDVTFWGLTAGDRQNIGNANPEGIPIPAELQDAVRAFVPKDLAPDAA